jgi:hypothetical protein
MASVSQYAFPQEGLDYLLGVVPKGGSTPSTLYVGLFTTTWTTIQGYGLTNINITLGTGTYPVTELASATGYTLRQPVYATSGGGSPYWGTQSAGTVTIGSNTVNVRQVTASGAVQFTNSSGSAWTNINGMFIATSATVGQASGAGTTVLWYAPFSDGSTVTLASGDTLNITPTWQSAPYPA